MRDLLIESEARRHMPVWAISRLYRRADGSYCSRLVGKWRAWSQEEAIAKAAYAIQRPALLQATLQEDPPP
jgi:hypothetical protein